jgi:mRNA interferase RelE/StbE
MWSVYWTEQALKKLAKLDTKTKQRIDVWARKIAQQENPRINGAALQGKKYKGLWRYRVGAYRLICQITDTEFIVLVLEVGHRSSIYS